MLNSMTSDDEAKDLLGISVAVVVVAVAVAVALSLFPTICPSSLFPHPLGLSETSLKSLFVCLYVN